MINKKALTREITELAILQTVSRAYAEIASFRMQKTRNSVLLNRNFLNSISRVFQDIIVSYKEEVQRISRQKGSKDGKNITFLSHNGKTVAVFLSANVGLYGDIVGKTFQKFASEIRGTDVEVTIIGKLGLSMFKDVFPNMNYTYFDFPDSEVRSDLLGEIITHLVAYEEIRIYYGKFRSVITQEPEVSKISSSLIDLENQQKVVSTPKKYIFEPSLDKILVFFESEIFASLMDQVMRESQLAKLASRITSMTKAGENITTRLKRMQLEKLRMVHSISNKKQINSIASLFLA